MKILTLEFPIKIGEKTISSLNFREEAIAEDYLSFDLPGGHARTQALIASLCGADIIVVRRLRGPDYLKADVIAGEIMYPSKSEEDIQKNVLES